MIELKVGDEVTLDIESIAYGGEGVARYNECVFFVPDVIPGEKVRAEITEVKKSFARALATEILEASPDRTDPRCKVYGSCGGCQYQHVHYERALAIKEKQVRETLKRLGGIEERPELYEPIIASPESFGYRNVITLKARLGKEGWELGYVGRDNQSVVPIENCPIASEGINKALKDITRNLDGMDSPELIRGVTLRESEDQVIFYPHYQQPLRFESNERLLFKWQDLRIVHGLDSFFQVNFSMIPKLIACIQNALLPDPAETLFDLYAGSGLFSLVLSRKYKRVVGVEINYEAITCFEENIRSNFLQNIIPSRGRVEERFPEVYRIFKGDKNIALVDPPREGLVSHLIPFLCESDLKKMVYVSCEISTLARDLRKLSSAFRIQKIWPLDMFPQTQYLEAVVLLEKI